MESRATIIVAPAPVAEVPRTSHGLPKPFPPWREGGWRRHQIFTFLAS